MPASILPRLSAHLQLRRILLDYWHIFYIFTAVFLVEFESIFPENFPAETDRKIQSEIFAIGGLIVSYLCKFHCNNFHPDYSAYIIVTISFSVITD